MWGGGGLGISGDECSVSGGDGERLLSKLSSTLTDGAVTTETGAYTSISQPSPPAAALTSEYLGGVLSKPVSSGREENQDRIHIQLNAVIRSARSSSLCKE